MRAGLDRWWRNRCRPDSDVGETGLTGPDPFLQGRLEAPHGIGPEILLARSALRDRV
jgi:hypothetical protein